MTLTLSKGEVIRMSNWLDETEEMVHRGRIKVPYTWSVGETGSRFFVTLRDQGRILGTRCPTCRMTFVPPRKACGRCFGAEMTWEEVAPRGRLLTHAIPRTRSDIHPLEPPFAYGIIRLDGADTGLTHLVAEFREGQLRAGLPVEAVFRDRPQGNILDIRYFRPSV
jgi:hypothetical protein